MPGPLAGVRIVDCSEIIAAPYAASMLSDMGADVIKVEPVAGEPWRLQNQFVPLESRPFLFLNRGKRGITLNLRDQRGRDAIYRMIEKADVFLMNYRPDTPARLGIDYETLSALNPRLIYVWNTAFGRKGPHAHRPGYDIIIQAYSGIMTTWGGERGGVPTTMGTAIADYVSGLTIAWAVSSALYARSQTGKGQLVDTSLLGTAVTLQPSRFFSVDSIDRERLGQQVEGVRQAREDSSSYPELQFLVSQVRANGGTVPTESPANIYYRCYQCKEGYIAIGNLSAALRRRFQTALGFEDLRYSGDPEYAAATEKGREIGRKLLEHCEARFLEKTVDEWVEYLDGCGVPCGPVLFPEELWNDEQVLANGLMVELEHESLGKVRMAGPAVQMSETPLAAHSAAPPLGAHTDSVLSEYGYSADQIAELRDAGVVR